MRRGTWVIGSFAVSCHALLCGCGGSSSGGSTDLSTPKAAVKTVADALRRGDAAALKNATINGDPAFIDMMASMMSSTKTLTDAAVAKFGDAGKTISNSKMPDFDKSLDNADVKEEGDTATVTPKDGNGEPVKLKKVDGQWKMDFAQAPHMPSKAEMDQMGPMFNSMVDANKTTAADINAGKYKSVEEARQGLSQKMMAAMMSNGPKATHDGAPVVPPAPGGAGQ